MSAATTRQLDFFFKWGFELLFIGATILGVDSLRDLSKTTGELNQKVGIILERTDMLQKQIDRHEKKLEDLKQQRHN